MAPAVTVIATGTSATAPTAVVKSTGPAIAPHPAKPKGIITSKTAQTQITL